jgi:hypothetical protein
MAVNLSPYGGVGAQFLDNAGNVLTGGKIFTYAAGTTTNQATYTTSAGIIFHPNPIILDASGRVPSGGEIWLTDGLLYKFVLTDSNDVLIATYDNIAGINSNFVNFTNEQEIQTATAGQTVFTLTTASYSPGTNSLSVFVDGVNQYGPGAQYAYLETNSNTITFTNGLHVGAEVKFTTSQLNSSGATDASQVSYTPPFTNSETTNVELKLAQTVSVTDFGAVGDGVTNDSAAIQNALNYIDGATYKALYFPAGQYRIASNVSIGANSFGAVLFGEGGFQAAGSAILVDFDGVGITNQSASVQFKNLAFKGLRLGASVAVKNQKSSNTDDMDTAFFECTFETFNTCIQHIGRGLLANNNTFAISDLAIDISWPTSGTIGTGVQALPYGMRKWLINGNFFHTLGNAIAITGANAQYFRAATITGNIMDIGRQFFTGPISFSTISGNSIQNANATPIAISQVCENVTISSNSIGGYEGSDPSVFKPAQCILFDTGTVVNGVSITGNDFHYTDGSVIRSLAAMENCAISGNTFRDYNLGATTNYPIFVSANMTRCTIVGNAFDTNPGVTRAIRVQGTATYCTITENTWDVSQGSLSNIDTLVQSIVQGSEVYLHVSDLGVQDSVNAEIQIVSTKNDASWTVATDNFGELAVYSLDTSGGGAGKRAAIRAKTNSTIGSTTYWQFSIANATTKDVPILNVGTSSLFPEADGTYNLGSATNRYSTVFATTGTINTSDANEKQQIRELTDAEKRVAIKLKSSIKAFKFNLAVSEKGDDARIHFGVIAQDVKTAFESEGLVAEQYSVFCSDELPDGSLRLGVRYSELLAFIIGAM